MCITLGNSSSAHSRCAQRDTESGEDGDGKTCLLCAEAAVWLLCVSGGGSGGTDGGSGNSTFVFLFQRQDLLLGKRLNTWLPNMGEAE